MKRAASMIACLLIGYGASRIEALLTAQSSSQTKPAYIVASIRQVKTDPTDAYAKQAKAAHDESGVPRPQFLGMAADRSGIHVLEGTWPYEGAFVIEKYPSMADLKKFWYSPGYQQAIKLRQGFRETNFIIAVEER